MKIIVHAGAGSISHESQGKYERVLKKACIEALKYDTLEECLSAALSVLELDPITNAGIHGGNLDVNGNISVDSAVMNGKLNFGSIGGLPAKMERNGEYLIVDQPHKVALKVLEKESQGADTLGRIPPLTLCGQEAFYFAESNNLVKSIKEDPTTELVTRRFKKHKSWLDAQTKNNQDIIQDTVGVIVINSRGETMAGVSSCGMSLKPAGRLGEAAYFGAGVWAQDATDTLPAFGVSISGQGEQIIRTNVARCLYSRIGHDCSHAEVEIRQLMMQDFIQSPLLKHYKTRDLGLIALSQQSLKTTAHLWIAHSTPAFALGWMNTGQEPKALISRKKLQEKYHLRCVSL